MLLIYNQNGKQDSTCIQDKGFHTFVINKEHLKKHKHARLPRFYHHIKLFMKSCSTIYLMQPNHGTSNYQIFKHFNKKLLRINILVNQIQLCAQIMIAFCQTGSHQLKIDLCRAVMVNYANMQCTFENQNFHI